MNGFELIEELEKLKGKVKKYKEENERLRKVVEAANNLVDHNPNIDMECSFDDYDKLKKALEAVGE